MKPKHSKAPTSQEAKFKVEIEDGHAIITGLANDFAGDLVIPSTLYGCPVTEIGEGAFDGYTELTSVVIPEGVTEIGEIAFLHCWSVTRSLDSYPSERKEDCD